MAGADEAAAEPRVILVAVGQAGPSDVKALEWALESFYRKGDDLRLVHVVPVVSVPSPVFVDMAVPAVPLQPSPSTTDLKMVEEAKHVIKERFDALLEPRGIPYTLEIVHYMVSNDNIGALICKRADTLKAHVVVMAKSQRGLLDEIVLGSVCKYCCAHCNQPLVILHV